MSFQAPFILTHRIRDAIQESAISMCRVGHHEEGVRLLHSHLTGHHDDGHAWELLGVILFASGQTHNALCAIETATTLIPITIGAELAIAECYVRLGLEESAHTIIDHILDKSVPSELIPYAVATASTLGMNFHALELCREAATRDPDCEQAWFGVTHYMCLCGYPNRLVLRVLAHVVELAPEVDSYRVTLACMAVNCEDERRAYSSVANMSVESLGAIACAHAMVPLPSLYESVRDDVRISACRKRLAELNSGESHSETKGGDS